MAGKPQHDFEDLLKKSLDLLESETFNSLEEIAERLGVNPNTFSSGMRRTNGIRTLQDLKNRRGFTSQLIESDGEKIELDIDGNFAEVRVAKVNGQIRTVDQLLKAANVDRNIWEPVEPTVRKWDVVLKIKQADADEINVVPSFYVASKLRRRLPIAFEPVIQPVTLPPYKKLKPKTTSKGIRRALIVNDPQVGFRRRLHTTELAPFHDRRVLDIALQIAEDETIDHISFGGDCLDLSEWSNKFIPEPEFFWTTQPAIIEWAWWLRQFRDAQPEAEVKQLEGNHDARLANLIVQNMRQAYRLKAVDELTLPPALSVPRLLALHDLAIDYVGGYPDNGYWLNDNVFIAHGDLVRSAPGATANEISKRQSFTTIFGHIHRRELIARRQKTNGDDLIFEAFCPGAACHIDGRVPGSTSTQQWQQGIAVVEYTQAAQNIIPIAIHNGQAMYNGKVWTARDRDDEAESILINALELVTA